MTAVVPSVPHIAPALHHASTAPPQGSAIDLDFFGSDASLKPTLSSPSPRTHSPTTLLRVSAPVKTPIPAKSEHLTYKMASSTPTAILTTVTPKGSTGILGWGMPAEITFFVSIAILGLGLPIALFFYLRRRRHRRAEQSVEEEAAASPTGSSIDMDFTLRGSTTRPPTASSWLEMLKHRTETPSPPHTNDDGKDDVYYEPPKPISFARKKFCTRLSGRTSEADIEKEVRELDEEVRRRSKLSRSRGQSVGVLPDPEDPCSECAMSYTHDERGHTQPVEGRKGTPIPFLASVELDSAIVAVVVKEVEEEEKEIDIDDIKVPKEVVKRG